MERDAWDAQSGSKKAGKSKNDDQSQWPGQAPTPKDASAPDSAEQASPLPGANLPKGGGAIKGMGEKFETNPVTGTAALTVPILTSPSRDGFGPSLSLSYDSGSGQGPFGFGWSMGLDSVSRKTSKGLPKYRDDIDSDVFLLSGSHELVPVLLPDGSRHEDRDLAPGFIVHRYRPRIESLFRRIERWSSLSAVEEVHWRVYSADDVLNIYGRSQNSRVYNPLAPEQTYSWLLSDTRDWKGNAMTLTYKSEDGVGADLTLQHQKRRGALNDARRRSNRYIKSVKYGNRKTFLDEGGQRRLLPSQETLDDLDYMFEVVFDYGEHNAFAPTPTEEVPWSHRSDAISRYTSGFEIRTARLCQRILMFHHFANEENVGMNCLVRSTDFFYQTAADGVNTSIYTFLAAVEQCGYRPDSREPSGYVKRTVPRLEFKYTEPAVDDTLRPVDPKALENVPDGLTSASTRWIDLYGEGVCGILTETDGAWYYKRNITPITDAVQNDGSLISHPMFEPLEEVFSLPSLAGKGKFKTMDLDGDGFLSIVNEDGFAGCYQSDDNEDWQTWTPFDLSFKARMNGDGMQLVDLTGDGHADAIFIDQALWYPSLGRGGFGAPEGFIIEPGELDSPALLFKHAPSNRVRFYFADLTGDGMQDVVLVGNGEVCFWPNLGYGVFGARTTMDNAPVFDDDDYFDPKRVIFADIDGSGTTDLVYLHRAGTRLYFNECGNSWSSHSQLASVKSLVAIQDTSPIDLHGNGTVCLVISDPLPARESAMQYVDLMSGIKPHLLSQFENNLGSTTKIHYSTSTKSYLQEKMAGKPWISRLPYPVSVVDSTETYDHISRNVFTSSYAYHHGHFDGTEREFRGFGMVEQWDTEKLSPITFPDGGSNLDTEMALPATHSKSWFHLGASLGSETFSRQYESEYYQHPALWLLPDTVLPGEIDALDDYDAYRALKGSLLRQETYMDDATAESTDEEIERAGVPVSISERNYSIIQLQPGTEHSSAVFTTAPREIFTFQLERNAQDARISHQITLERNKYGQTMREVAIGYGRQSEDLTLPTQWDRDEQTRQYITYTENLVTNPIDDPVQFPHAYRLPINCQRREYELTGTKPLEPELPFTYEHFSAKKFKLLEDAEEIAHDAQANTTKLQKRLLVLARTICRSDDLKQLMPMGAMGVSGHIGQAYGMAFTAENFERTYQRGGTALLPSPDSVLTDRGGGGGGYFSSSELKARRLFPANDPYDGYWTGAGYTFFSMSDDADTELAQARSHFYNVVRAKNVFEVQSSVTYDEYDLLIVEATDTTGNVVTVGERDAAGSRQSNGNDYRTLHPKLLTDANGNRSAVATDALGTVVGNAAMGKPGEPVGDSLDGFEHDLSELTMLAYLENPTVDPKAILQGAGERFVYDILAFVRSKSSGTLKPVVAACITRATHEASMTDEDTLEMHHSFTYSDGFGRVIQAKSQSKPGPVAKRDASGHIILDDEGRPVMTDDSVNPRWTASGWTVYNNKGMVVAQYEPYFTHLAGYEFEVRAGVSTVAFYDALGRAVLAVNPNGTYTKTLFTPWTKEVWDNNDTVELDPRTDPHVKQYTAAYFASRPLFKTWLEIRMALPLSDPRRQAGDKARVHSRTPMISNFDCLGRIYLKTGWNRVRCAEHELDGQEWKQHTRIEFDIQSRGLAVRDANEESGGDMRGRIVEVFEYDMRGEAMVRRSIDSGATFYLLNAAREPFYQWNDRGHRIKTVYDKAGRHLLTSLIGDEFALGGPASEVIVNYKVYGEHHPSAAALNMNGKTWLVVDQAALYVNEKRDFKGLLLVSSKRLCTDYKKTVDWTALSGIVSVDMDPAQVVDEAALAAVLDTKVNTETFRASTTYDGLDRPIKRTSPNSDGSPSTTVFGYEINSIESGGAQRVCKPVAGHHKPQLQRTRAT